MKKGSFLENLFPGYFALVMATGIVSIATHLLRMQLISIALFGINLVCYIVLCVFTILRLFIYPGRFFADLTSHARGPGFFSLVAGSCVLGTQFILLTSLNQVAFWFWVVALVIWLIVMYTFFTAATVRSPKPSLEDGINGAWLLAIVATQSLSILGTLLTEEVLAAHRIPVLFTCLCLFLLGSMLYLLIISIIFYRLMFINVEAKALTPPYWINMGAIAITTLAGVTIVTQLEQWLFLEQIGPFLKGFTLFFWATCTWWIPMLLILGVWRHVYKKEPLVYDPQYWGIVFPLGMYVTCTLKLAQNFGLDFLMFIPNSFIYLPIAAWVLTFGGMIQRISKSVAS